jgi:hypothetical protein
MTDTAQRGNNLPSSAQGAPKPNGDKPKGTEAGHLSQGAPRTDAGQKPAIGAARTKTEDGTVGASTARAAFQGDHPQRSAAVREGARGEVEQRGAGSGEDAKFTRTRSLVEWPPEPLTHAEHVEELLEIAQENEDYNNRVNKEQTAITRDALTRIGSAAFPLGDPKLEQESRDKVLEDYKRERDPATRRERLKGEMEARAARDRKQEEQMYGMKQEPDARDVGDPKGRLAARDKSEAENKAVAVR